jgi:hypothetical protein
MKRLAVALLLLSAACATTPTGPASVPQGALDLGGDWRRASPSSVLHQFENEVSRRYRPGLTLAAASSDLGRQSFRCAPNADTRGAAPDQICRKTVTVENCTHTWQVHLWAQSGGALERTRALYDRRCGGEGLLGGPS